MKAKLNIPTLIKLKNELRKFKKTSINGFKKKKICKTFDITNDEINIIIQQIAYENMIKQKEKV